MQTGRTLAALVSAALLVAGLAGCGDSGGDPTIDQPGAVDAGHGDGPEDHEEAMAGNPCAPDAPDDALPPPEHLDADATPVTITATEYGFAGSEPLAAGGAFAVTFVNDGAELHELVLVRVADDETRPAAELVASDEEPELTDVAFGMACPGGQTTFNADIAEPGRYLAVCFVPVGSTPAATEEVEGPPHATQGMVVELTVEA